MCERYIDTLSLHAPTEDWARNPGLCPGEESNWRHLLCGMMLNQPCHAGQGQKGTPVSFINMMRHLNTSDENT